MKPLQIEMSAFGSYKGRELVDFEKIDHGIFLITGDTGAGKTTIFDAVTFALFGETSGQDRDGTMMRSQYAREEDETYVSLKFKERGLTYEIWRSPVYYRRSKKKNKQGEYSLIQAPAKARFILPDGKEFPGNIRDINLKIQEIVGVDKDQFSQISMIAQGAYLKLLHAPSRERKDIFSRIFNTEIYSRIQGKLRDKNNTLYGKLEDNKKLCNHELHNVELPNDSKWIGIWQDLLEHQETKAEEVREILEEIIKESREEEKEVKCLAQDCRKELSLIENRLVQAQDVNRLFDSMERAAQRLLELEGQKAYYEELEEKLGQAKKAEKVLAVEKNYLQKEKEIKEAVKRVENLEKGVGLLEQELERGKKELDEYENQARERLPQIMGEISKIQDALPLYGEWKKSSQDLKEETLRVHKAEDKGKRLEKEIKDLASRIEKTEIEIEALDKKAKELPLLSMDMLSLEKRKEGLEDLRDTAERYESARAAEKEKQEITRAAQLEYEKAESLYNQMYREFLEEQAGIMAKDLEEDMPCPVCGSLHHPRKAPLSQEAVTQARVEKGKKSRDRAEEIRSQAAMESIKTLEALNYNKEQLVQKSSKWLKEAVLPAEVMEKAIRFLEECNSSLKAAQQKEKEAEEALKLLEMKEKLLSECKEQQRKLENTREEVLGQWQEHKVSLAKLTVQEEQIRARLPMEEEKMAEDELNRFIKEKKQLEEGGEKAREQYTRLGESLKEKTGRLSSENENRQSLVLAGLKAQDAFKESLDEQGFENVRDYYNAVKSGEILKEWEERGREYQRRVLENTTIYNQYKEQTAGRERVDTRLWQEQQDKLNEELAKALEKESYITGRRTGNEKAGNKLMVLWKERRTLEKEFNVIHTLYRTANGKLSGSVSLDFQTYVQRQYFNRMIQAANRRLKVMTEGGLLLQCRDLAALGKQGEVGLDLDVYSVATDKIRDVKTLSGGESFMAALSMALGMADIIQSTAGNVRMDAMFIDEGFGSLDEESRMRAIRILKELAGEKRLIGIISHVSELKEQIGRKLVVRKNETGSHVDWNIED